MYQIFISLFVLTLSSSLYSLDVKYQYAEIDKRYASVSLNSKKISNAKMQGECLVGLKNLNFKKANTFDAVAEWTSYRSVSLLEQYSPCEVLIMMETAKSKLSMTASNK
ncbi:MAG: hypothetical protein HRU20_04220 [Pseudomonadales bacterium]|nr:hypothetical protein [Pseudomonadales bacterium]